MATIVWKSRKVHDVQIDLPPFWVPEARSLLNWFETKGSIGAILRSYVNVNGPEFFKDRGGYTHLLHAFATRESRKNLTISETSSS